MTAPAPSPAEQAEIERFGIFEAEERVVEEVARAIGDVIADDTESVLSAVDWDQCRRLAAAAVAGYRATQDGGAEEAVLVTWRDCSCDWATKFCDEEHARRSFVPRAVLATQDGGCPTCAGRTRETVGMVCQTCGTDYAPQAGDGAR